MALLHLVERPAFQEAPQAAPQEAPQEAGSPNASQRFRIYTLAA